MNTEPIAGPWQRLLARSFDYYLESVCFTVIISLLGIAALALFMKGADIASVAVSGITVGIKLVSIVAGVIAASAKILKRGFAVGGCVAIVYWIVMTLLTLLCGIGAVSVRMIGDALLNIVFGVLAGILSVNAIK